MPFAKRKGYLLVAIGEGLGWANAHVCAHLPTGLRTLCHLARLERFALERLIEEGVIHPALKESEARELVARIRCKRLETKSRKPQVKQWLRRCAEFVRANARYWNQDERELAIGELVRLIEEIGGSGPIASEQAADLLPPPIVAHLDTNFFPVPEPPLGAPESCRESSCVAPAGKDAGAPRFMEPPPLSPFVHPLPLGAIG